MKVIEITDHKVEKMSELVEEMLHTGGKLMNCLEHLSGEMYGERRRVGMRHHDYEDYDEMMHERRYSPRYR